MGGKTKKNIVSVSLSDEAKKALDAKGPNRSAVVEKLVTSAPRGGARKKKASP